MASDSGCSEESYDAVPPPPREGPFRLLTIGRLVHWKGVYLAIRIFGLFALKNRTAELWIVNNGPFKKHLQKMAEESGVGDRIHFLGFLPDPSGIFSKLAEAHVLLHMALHEAFGGVVMEAMAAGRPVACLDIGGPAAQITPECGFAAPISSPHKAIEATVDFLERISEDRALLDLLNFDEAASMASVFRNAWVGALEEVGDWFAEFVPCRFLRFFRINRGVGIEGPI